MSDYIIDFELCALLFLIVVTVRFLMMHKFRSKSNMLFTFILFFGIADISLDVIGGYFLNNPGSVSAATNYSVNIAFFVLQVAMPAMVLLYVMILSGHKPKKMQFIYFIPAIAVELLVLTAPLNGLVFSIENINGVESYVRGPLFYSLYASGALYFIISSVTVLRLRRFLRKAEVRAIIIFATIIILSVVIQICFPHYLLTGVAMSLAILIMFLTMQNPETMLDAVTGTFNYSALTDHIRINLSESREMWLSSLDVGGIRRINSTMGIRAGNELLEKVGSYINGICTSHALAFRMLGTRFVIISDNEETHHEIITALTERFKTPWICNETNTMLMATIRYFNEKNDFHTAEDIMELIDLAYSDTADEGFGTTKAVETGKILRFRRQSAVSEALKRALSTGEGFYLNYQPLYSVTEKKFISAEALLRFNDKKLGNISPAEFIPIAESDGLIHAIDSIVIKQSCDFVKSHPQLFGDKLRVLEVNLSASEFNSDTKKFFNEIVENTASIENKICFEVTETAVTDRREILSEFMNSLIERGISFAIDDYGTGYANIMRLAKLPFSIVKMDRLFASHSEGKESIILKDLVSMFDNLGLTTVLEGVETLEQAEFAASIGIDEIQGYYYSRPIDGDALVKLICT